VPRGCLEKMGYDGMDGVWIIGRVESTSKYLLDWLDPVWLACLAGHNNAARLASNKQSNNQITITSYQLDVSYGLSSYLIFYYIP
jgi:hypothetical protein